MKFLTASMSSQRDDVDAELLGQLWDLSRTLLQHLARVGVRCWAQLRRMLGDDGERCHDVLLLLVLRIRFIGVRRPQLV
jgi:hypothetical protein